MHQDEPEDVDVQVTDEDMQDPEYLAQLAGFGHVEASDAASEPPIDPTPLETQIEALKARTLQLKRENRIQEALACMRSMKELERQRDQLQATQMSPTPVPYMVDRVPQTNIEVNDTPVRTPVAIAHAYAAPAFQSGGQNENDDGDSDVDVTEDDMNDPSFQDELAKLGFSDDAASISSQETSQEPRQPSATTQAASHSEQASQRRVPQLRTIESVDEDGLIDEFESDSDEDDDGGDWKKPSAPSYRPLEATSIASVTAPPSIPTTSSAGESSVADLQSQLNRARRTALELKRAGKLNEALESLRRAKQIEDLIQLKQTAGIPTKIHVPVQGPQQDPVVALKFQELERLLVEFGNHAMESAKENLSSDRVAAASWLKKVCVQLIGG